MGAGIAELCSVLGGARETFLRTTTSYRTSMLYAKTAWWLPDDAAVARRDTTLATIAAGAAGAAVAAASEGGSVGSERMRCRIYSVLDGHNAGAAPQNASSGSAAAG